MSVFNSFSDTYPVPLGTVVFYSAPASKDPDPTKEYAQRDLGKAWLCCDGRYLKREGEFAPLFKMIGSTFGSQDATDFRLPVAADFNNFGSRGYLPRSVAVNDGVKTDGVGGTAILTATITEANIPPLNWNGEGTTVAGIGLDVENQSWTSAINNGRSVMQNDTTGAGSGGADVNGSFVIRNNPIIGMNNITATAAGITRLAATPVPLSQTLALKGELPQRYEMRMMIRSKN
jgi:microcystin-dependent protein